jgi:hypothetical protein
MDFTKCLKSLLFKGSDKPGITRDLKRRAMFHSRIPGISLVTTLRVAMPIATSNGDLFSKKLTDLLDFLSNVVPTGDLPLHEIRKEANSNFNI